MRVGDGGALVTGDGDRGKGDSASLFTHLSFDFDVLFSDICRSVRNTFVGTKQVRAKQISCETNFVRNTFRAKRISC